jgi:hypothetical protein
LTPVTDDLQLAKQIVTLQLEQGVRDAMLLVKVRHTGFHHILFVTDFVNHCSVPGAKFFWAMHGYGISKATFAVHAHS